jgi:sorbose reductase
MAQAISSCNLAGIAILDVLQDAGDEAAAALHAEFGIPSAFYKIDVRDEKAVSETIQGIKQDFGRVDILICSAGICDNIKAENYEADRFRRVMDINVTGSFLCAQACAREMIEQKQGGSIIFIASMSGHIVNYPQPQCAYNASKAAVLMLAKSLAAEWSPYAIRVNTISPGYMATKLTDTEAFRELKTTWASRTPLGRLGQDYELNGRPSFSVESI